MQRFDPWTPVLIGSFTLLCSLAWLVPAAHAQSGATASATATAKAATARSDSGAQAFRNAAVGPPPGWQGRVFQLSRNYPASVPATCADCGWLRNDLKVDFQPRFPAQAMKPAVWTQGDWATYSQRILDYVKQGQDPDLADAKGFQTQVNGRTRWFNVPWMAVDPTVGREFIHGATNERTVHLSDLLGQPAGAKRGVHHLPGPSQACKDRYPNGFESWSVGYYNEWGGQALGRMFGSDGKPRMGSYQGTPVPAGLPFPEGTIVIKVLTTSATEDCLPMLRNAAQWTVHRHVLDAQRGYLCERAPQVSHVVQLDVAVVDKRNPNRWVYGTFVYDGTLPGKTVWDRLMPLGLQWGSDPWTFPAVPRAESQPLQQSILNPAVKLRLPEHQGCEMRLAGPVDNAQSSCVSCHASAYAAPVGQLTQMGVNVPPSFGFDGMCVQYSSENANYFQNVRFPQAFPGGRYPLALFLDTSQQLEVAFGQYALHHTRTPQACHNPGTP